MSTVDTAAHHTVEDAEHELYSVVTEVNVVHLVFTLLSVFILIFGMFSALIKERIYVGEAVVATAFGIIFGPYVANLIDPRSWGNPSFDDITLEFTRIVLALSVFAVGVELPKAYVKRHWQSLAMLLGPLMIFGWLVTGAFIYALIPGLSFLGSLIIAACATPTDPILAASVVGKGKFAQKHVPSHIRHLLQAESGCNDGAAFPFLYLAMFLNFRGSHNVGEAVGWWILLVIMYQIILGIIIGVAVGITARKVLKFSKRRSFIDRESMVAMYVSLAIFTTAVTTLAGSDDLLAAFACGAAFAWDDWFSESIEDSNFSNIIDLLVNCATFIYIGATIPFTDFNNSDLTITPWRLVVIGILVLVARRLPAMLLLYKWIPDIKTFREAVFAGHFGPMGVGAIFIATLALTKLPTPTNPPVTSDDFLALNIQPIIYFIVLCSVIVHGSSIPFFNLGKRVHSFHRTMTNRSDSEPNWLSRVKRVGEGDDVVNRDDNNEKKGEKGEKNGRDDVDLEAGERVMDDAGMDIGDMSTRDYAQGGSDPEKRASPTASSDTVQGSDKGKEREESPEAEHNAEDHHKKRDERQERHDSDESDDEEDVWQEGPDTIIERKHGEDTITVHKDGSREERDFTQAGDTKTGEASTKDGEASAGGFPGHRMQEIAAMIERGHGMSHDIHEQSSAEDIKAKAEGKKKRSDEKPSKRLLTEAAERVAREESNSRSRERSAPSEAASDHGEGEDQVAPLGNATPSPARPGKMLSLDSFINRPKATRKATLTHDEKLARDAWCRRERKDAHDDEVRTWVSGKHMVIERNNGEDVEVVDANPGIEAREQARRDPNLKIRAVDISSVAKAKGDILDENEAGESSSRGRSQQPHGAKRFDLKAIRNNASFRKIFGEGHPTEERSVSPEPAADGRRQSSPPRNITFSDAADERPVRETQGASASGSGTGQSTSSGNGRGESSSGGKGKGESTTASSRNRNDTPNYLSTRGNRSTGVPLERSETTESQVRFGALPKGKRR